MLTDTAVRQAKPRERDYKLYDSAGLYLFVTTTGGKTWRLDYRFGDKRRTLSIGPYPTVSLAHARQAREAARRKMLEGINPNTERKAEKAADIARAANTFRRIAEQVIAKMEREQRAEATLVKTRWLMERIYPALGDRPIVDITAPDILAVLRPIEERGRYETARRLRSTIGMVFRYAIATGCAKTDPTVALVDALTTPKVTHYAAILEPAAVGGLLRAIESFAGLPAIHAALRLAPHVFVLPGELRQAEWAEFDLGAALWIIPGAKTKMRRPLRVPLTRQSLAILHEIQTLTGEGRFVFPCTRTPTRAMSENSVNAALRRMGYGTDEMTCHGFRAMASSLLNESGKWNPDAIERQLGHVDNNDVRRAYARAEFWDERVRMMAWWSDYLDALRDKTVRKGETPSAPPASSSQAPNTCLSLQTTWTVEYPKGRITW